MVDSNNQYEKVRTVKRRKMLKALAACSIGISGLSGCAGQSDTGGTGNNSEGTGNNSEGTGNNSEGTGNNSEGTGNNSEGTGNNSEGTGNNSEGTGTTKNSDEWPDHSGKELHFVTDENSSQMQKFFKKVGKEFESATGAKVKMEFGQQGSSAEQRLSQLIQAGNPPDLFTTSMSQGTQLVYGENILRPMNSVLDGIADKYSDPIPGARLTQDGDDYLVPWTASGDALWYRADLFDEPPETWDDMLAQAKAHDNPNGTRAHFQPAAPGFCTLIILLSWAYSNDSRIAQNNNGEVEIVMGEKKYQERWVETLDFMKELHQYSPLAADASCAQQVQAVGSGSAASTLYPARVKINAIDTKPDMAKNLHPTLIPKNRSNTTNGVVEGLISFKGSNGDVADTYISFLFQEDYLIQFYSTTPVHLGPPYKAIQNSDAYQKMLDNLPSQWSKEDIEISFEQNEKMLSVATETEPPNPYAGAITGSGHLSQMTYDVLVDDQEPSEVVGPTAQKLEDALKSAKE